MDYKEPKKPKEPSIATRLRGITCSLAEARKVITALPSLECSTVLRGATVKAIKEDLREALESERDALSQLIAEL